MECGVLSAYCLWTAEQQHPLVDRSGGDSGQLLQYIWSVVQYLNSTAYASSSSVSILSANRTALDPIVSVALDDVNPSVPAIVTSDGM